MRKITFIADFADKKKGEVWECDGMLANYLVTVDKVADYVLEKDEKADKPKKGSAKISK